MTFRVPTGHKRARVACSCSLWPLDHDPSDTVVKLSLTEAIRVSLTSCMCAGADPIALTCTIVQAPSSYPLHPTSRYQMWPRSSGGRLRRTLPPASLVSQPTPCRRRPRIVDCPRPSFRRPPRGCGCRCRSDKFSALDFPLPPFVAVPRISTASRPKLRFQSGRMLLRREVSLREPRLPG
jgi:hypothetical protein